MGVQSTFTSSLPHSSPTHTNLYGLHGGKKLKNPGKKPREKLKLNLQKKEKIKKAQINKPLTTF